jgi:ribonuclease P protein component
VLNKTQRLRNRRDFKTVYARGRSYVHPMLVLYALPVREEKRLIGFSVSKKIGGAVERNRVKRRLREVLRARMEQSRPGYLAVFVARSRAKEATFPELEGAVEDLLKRARLMASPPRQDSTPCEPSSE